MFQIDLQSRTPIYEQLVRNVIKLKNLGVLEADEKLPPVRALALQLGVNPNTVQKAYQLLEAKGVIYSSPGRGSFISGEKDAEKVITAQAENEFRQAAADAAALGLSFENAVEILKTIYAKEGTAND